MFLVQVYNASDAARRWLDVTLLNALPARLIVAAVEASSNTEHAY